jgi:hypothetical protein
LSLPTITLAELAKLLRGTDMASVSASPNTETPTKHSSRVLTVMSAMRAAGYGYENIYVDLNAMGFAISRDACRKFVIPNARRPSAGATTEGL